jgi:superfamily II DNA helicase RecQ
LLSYIIDRAAGTPYTIIRQTKQLATTISSGEHSAAKLEPVGSDGRCAIQDGNKLSIDDVSLMLQRMIAELMDTLKSNVLHGLDVKWLDKLVDDDSVNLLDNWQSDEVGYNFINSNQQLKSHRNDLIDHLFLSAGGQRRFIIGQDADGRIVYDRPKLMDFLDIGDQCFLEFAKANHIGAGEPMRGDEYASLNATNTASGDRSYFWSQAVKTVFFWQTYTKTEGFSAPETHIARLVAPDMLKVFLLLEVIVRPTLNHVAFNLWPTPDEREQFAYNYKTCWLVRRGIPLTGRQFGASLANSFLHHVGFPVGLLQWRHWAAFFGEYVQKQFGSGKLLLPLDIQAGHSRETAVKVYATTTADERGLHRDKFVAFCAASQAWHAVFGCDSTLKQRAVQPSSTTHQSPTIPILACAPPPENAVTLSTTYPKVVIGRELVAIPTKPHQVTVLSGQPHPPANFCHSLVAHKVMRQLGFSKWTCAEQALAAAIVVENKRSIGVVLPTGCGKSLLFQIPALLHPDKCTVVVVFLAELRQVLHDEAAKAGINATVYKDVRSLDVFSQSSLLVIGPEQAIDNDFVTKMRTMVELDRLFAIFFDEVHLSLEKYRDVMLQLPSLGRIGVPFIAISATVSPGNDEKLVQYRIGRDLDWIRRPTVRPNIKYTVDECEDIDQSILGCLRQWKNDRTSADDRAIVYCWTRAEVERLSNFLTRAGLSVTMGHSGKSHTENAEERRLFEAGKYLILVTSPQLGCGYNYPCVTLVLHRVLARSIKDYVQQSGRSGRNGKPAIAKIITNKAAARQLILQTRHMDGIESDDPNLLSMEEYICNVSQCRRWLLHSSIDYFPSQCFLAPADNFAACDICQKEILTHRTMVASKAATQRLTLPSTGNPITEKSNQIVRDDDLVDDSQQLVIQDEETFVPPAVIAATHSTLVFGQDCQIVQAVIQYLSQVPKNFCLACYFDLGLTTTHQYSFQCPVFKVGTKCCRCLGDGHLSRSCPYTTIENPSCRVCGLYTRSFTERQDGSIIEPHPGEYGSGCKWRWASDSLRMLVWRVWRDNKKRDKMAEKIPTLIALHNDKAFGDTLFKVQPGKRLTLFHQMVGEIIMERHR